MDKLKGIWLKLKDGTILSLPFKELELKARSIEVKIEISREFILNATNDSIKFIYERENEDRASKT